MFINNYKVPSFTPKTIDTQPCMLPLSPDLSLCMHAPYLLLYMFRSGRVIVSNNSAPCTASKKTCSVFAAGMLSSMQRQTLCICTTENTHTHTHRYSTHRHKHFLIPKLAEMCWESENETQTWSVECLVAMGVCSVRQSAWWCLYEEGWMITRTKFVCQLPGVGGGGRHTSRNKGSSPC